MGLGIQRLLSVASEPISARETSVRGLDAGGRLGQELAKLLEERNGFWAYELSLLVRPMRNPGKPFGSVEWNANSLWKNEFKADLAGAWFFAEDAFGCQYCLRGKHVCLFDPETAAFETISDSLENWAAEIVANASVRTGFRLAQTWQTANGPLPAGSRLLPKTPFVLGGRFEPENFYACGDVEGMKFRASIANQISGLPDGARVTIRQN